MWSEVVLCLVLCAIVFADISELESCSTRGNTPGKCLYTNFCPGELVLDENQRLSSGNMRTCGSGMVCCKIPEIAANQQRKPGETHFKTQQDPSSKSNVAGNSGIIPISNFITRPRRGPKNNKARRRITRPTRPLITSALKPTKETSESSIEEAFVTKINATQGLDSSIDLDGNQIILPSSCVSKVPFGRIFGGVETSIGEFPWMAILEFNFRNESRMACGGSLITNWHVLTAAHCVHEKGLKRRSWTLRSVRLGEWDMTTDPDCISESAFLETNQKLRCAPKFLRIPVQKIYIHPHFEMESASQQNDIALLKLSKPVQFNEYVRPICLPKSDKNASYATVAGWGRTEEIVSSNLLLKVNLPVANRKQCQSDYERKGVTLMSSHLCFGKAGKDSCGGDSGGPLMLIEDFGFDQISVEIIGIVSLGPKNCGTTQMAGLYTKVFDYMPWIREQMRLTHESREGFSVNSRTTEAPEIDAVNDEIIFPRN